MSIVGIDHGTRRSGVAIEVAGVALPKGVIQTVDLLDYIWDICKQYSVTALVVGQASHRNSRSVSPQEQIQKNFCWVLKQAFPNLEILSHPEWFSTKQARFELERAGLPSDGTVDDLSAAIILQDYIDSH